MAIGLIKKEIIHGSGSSKSPIMKTRNRRRLESATADYQSEMKAYEGQDFKNPYAEAKNRFANLDNSFEDLTVNQQQSQFEAQQNQQSQANIMQNLQGAAGSSGVAGLAQSLANQSQVSAQRASASIGQQESRNQQLAAQQGAKNQQLAAKGGTATDMARMGGEANLQQMDSDKQATMLGMSMQQVGNAQQAIAAQKQMMGQIIGGVAGAVGSAFAGKLG